MRRRLNVIRLLNQPFSCDFIIRNLNANINSLIIANKLNKTLFTVIIYSLFINLLLLEQTSVGYNRNKKREAVQDLINGQYDNISAEV